MRSMLSEELNCIREDKIKMIRLSAKGNLSKVIRFLNKLNPNTIYSRLDKYGQMGVEALSKATPKRTGLTASSWYYDIYVGSESASITWANSNKNKGVPIALVIQYGHGMPNGGYVKGIDYINPAMRPVFKKIQESVLKEMTEE